MKFAILLPMAAWDPVRFFAALPLFRAVPPSVLSHFAWKSRRQAFRKGDYIFQEGEPAEHAWWVAEGYVKIAKITPQGRLLTMEMLVKGDIFSPTGLMSLKAYPANAVAVTDAAVVRATREDMADLVITCPQLPQSVLTQVSQRLQRAHRLRALDAESAEKRVAAALLWLSEKTGASLTMSRREISEIAGVAPETAIRVVLQFKEKLWVDANARSLTLTDTQALQSFIDQV